MGQKDSSHGLRVSVIKDWIQDGMQRAISQTIW